MRESRPTARVTRKPANLLPSDVPHPLAIEERDDAILADLEDGAEPAGRKSSRCTCAFDNLAAVGQILGWKVAENRASSQQLPLPGDDRGAVERGQRGEHAGVEVHDRPALQQMQQV